MTQPKTPKPPDIPLTLAIEPWDWRQGVSLTQPLLICTWIKDRWISHVSIPAGRNTFRIWLLYQNPTNAKGANSHTSRIRIAMDSSHKGSLPTTQSSEVGSSVQSESSKKKKNAAPFSVRIVSQTPIYVGSKEEVLSYMTNPPMLLLKQCGNYKKSNFHAPLALFICTHINKRCFYKTQSGLLIIFGACLPASGKSFLLIVKIYDSFAVPTAQHIVSLI